MKKDQRFSTLYSFIASRKSTVSEAYPGDVVGIYDRGNLKIGDSLTDGEDFTFRGIPNFSPEIFKELVSTDPMRSKQLNKGITHLTEEGVAQLLYVRYFFPGRGHLPGEMQGQPCLSKPAHRNRRGIALS